jgi:hypothetical protein
MSPDSDLDFVCPAVCPAVCPEGPTGSRTFRVSRVSPPLRGTRGRSVPAARVPARVLGHRSWFPESWPGWQRSTRPDPCFPEWYAMRQNPCKVCGAPPGALCMTRNGNRSTNHVGRGIAMVTK